MGLYDEYNWSRLASCVPLSLHTMERQIHKNEPIHGPDFMDFKKMWSEVQLKEIKVILGWYLDTRRLTARLPDNKYKDWSRDITDILEKRLVRGKDMEYLEGRLNYASLINPLG